MIDLDGCRLVIERMRPDLLYCYDSFASKIQVFAIERYDGYPFVVTSLLEPCELEILSTYMGFMDTYCAYCEKIGKDCDEPLLIDELRGFIAKYGALILTIASLLYKYFTGSL